MPRILLQARDIWTLPSNSGKRVLEVFWPLELYWLQMNAQRLCSGLGLFPLDSG